MKFLDILEEELMGVLDYSNSREYIMSPRGLTGNCKWEFIDFILYLLTNKGKSSTLEIEDYVEKRFDDDESKLITKQYLSKIRKIISPKIFYDMNQKFLKKFYKSEEYEYLFKDSLFLIVDGSGSEIPNTPITKKEFNIVEDSLTNKKAARTKISTIIDGKYGIVLDAILGKSDASEREMAKQHFKNLKGIINYKNIISAFDAGYFSLELMIFLDRLGIEYIFRLPSSTYKHEISQMTTMDEIVKIKMNSNRRQNIEDESILEYVKKRHYIERRIIKLPIINSKGKEEEMIFLTNIPKTKANTYEITGLYAGRWEIEVNYDRLKNKTELENYSGKLEHTIKQDFLSSIYIHNLAMILRNNIHKHLERKNKKKREMEDKEYRTNFNTLIGRIKNRLLDLLTSSKEKIKRIIERIIRRGTKDIYLHDFKRPTIYWHMKRFVGKFRFNQRRNS